MNNLNLVNLYLYKDVSIHNANCLFYSTFYQSAISTFPPKQMTVSL